MNLNDPILTKMTYRRNSYPRDRAKFLSLVTFDQPKGRFDHLDYEKSNLHEHHKFLYQRISSRFFPFLELDIRILDIFPFLKEIRLRTIRVMLDGIYVGEITVNAVVFISPSEFILFGKIFMVFKIISKVFCQSFSI